MSPYKNHRWREGLKLSLLNIPLRKHWKPLLLGGLLLLSFLLKLNHLGHQRLRGVDECCHALVAKNLLKHPLKPTLIETPYLLYEETAHGVFHLFYYSLLKSPMLGESPAGIRITIPSPRLLPLRSTNSPKMLFSLPKLMN